MFYVFTHCAGLVVGDGPDGHGFRDALGAQVHRHNLHCRLPHEVTLGLPLLQRQDDLLQSDTRTDAPIAWFLTLTQTEKFTQWPA